MTIAVRYYSRLGNTKTIAQAIAKGANTSAISIMDEPELPEHVDLLFLGGAPYADIRSKHLRKYAVNIKPEMVSKVALFTTSNWSRRTVHALRKILKNKGIEVEENTSMLICLESKPVHQRPKSLENNILKLKNRVACLQLYLFYLR